MILSTLGNFINALATVLNLALTMYMWVVVARAVLSWVNPDPFNPIVRAICNITDPVLRLVRSKIPSFEGVDISPVIVILAIYFLRLFLVESLFNIALRMMRM
jgi:YggT family protein